MDINQNIILKNENLVDVVSSTIYHASVMIRDGVISKIIRNNDSLEFADASNIHTIDLTGKWLIAGLIDMHVHIKEGMLRFLLHQVLQLSATREEMCWNYVIYENRLVCRRHLEFFLRTESSTEILDFLVKPLPGI
jgi:predicted amidohydrolase YtcJ